MSRSRMLEIDTLGDVVLQLHRQELDARVRLGPATTLEDVVAGVEAVASYTYLDDGQPIPRIVCPGSPPFLVEQPGRQPNQPFLGMVQTQFNKHMFPSAPMAPTFAAIHHCSPSLDIGSYDMLTDRSSLTRLLRWIVEDGSRRDGVQRVDLEVTESGLLVLIDFDRTPPRQVQRLDYRRFTRQRAVGSGTLDKHYRITTLDLRGLTLLVRTPIEARLPTSQKEKRLRPAKEPEVELSIKGGGRGYLGRQPSERIVLTPDIWRKKVVPSAEIAESLLVPFDSPGLVGDVAACLLTDARTLLRIPRDSDQFDPPHFVGLEELDLHINVADFEKLAGVLHRVKNAIALRRRRPGEVFSLAVESDTVTLYERMWPRNPVIKLQVKHLLAHE